MKISDAIQRLQNILRDHGDLDVVGLEVLDNAGHYTLYKNRTVDVIFPQESGVDMGPMCAFMEE